MNADLLIEVHSVCVSWVRRVRRSGVNLPLQICFVVCEDFACLRDNPDLWHVSWACCMSVAS